MRLDRIYVIHQILKTARLPVPMKRFQEVLGRSSGKEEVSRDTIERILDDLRGFYGAPLEKIKDGGRTVGWQYTSDSYELPGLWFSPDQLAGLLFLEQALEQMQAGFLADYLGAFKILIKTLLGKTGQDAEIKACVKLLHFGKRKGQYEHFSTVAQALLNKQKLVINYYSRKRDEHTPNREISPQRLILYRDNWYLDAYCHQKQGLRQFAVDCIKQAEIKNESANQLDNKELDEFINQTYGIFYQPLNDWALLRFSAYQSRWVKNEVWHPEQKSQTLEDGRYELTVPFGDKTELIQQILKYGVDVEVVSPESLRKEVIGTLQKTLAQYQN